MGLVECGIMSADDLADHWPACDPSAATSI